VDEAAPRPQPHRRNYDKQRTFNELRKPDIFTSYRHAPSTPDEGFAALRRSEGSGRPVGTAEFVAGLERVLGRPIARRAPGRKPAAAASGQLELGV
jgi:hypothetical protein